MIKFFTARESLLTNITSLRPVLAAAVPVLPGPLAHSDKLEVGAVPGELGQLVAALDLQRLVAPHPAVGRAQQLRGLHRGPVP